MSRPRPRRLVGVLVIGMALWTAAISAVASTEVVAMWTRIYRNAETLEQRTEVAQALVEQDDPSLVPLFEEALFGLIGDERTQTTLLERQTYNQLLEIVLDELGDLRARNAAPAVMDVIGYTEDDIVRAAAVTAIGRMGATAYAAELSTLLRNLNFESVASPGAREQRQAKERLARATVVALGRLKDAVGFEPAFFASIGWYSRDSGVAAEAQRAMDGMVTDPSQQFEKLIRDDASFEVKLAALLAEDASTAGAAGKVGVAVAALEQGLIHQPSNLTEEVLLSRLRTISAEMMRRYAVADASAIPFLQRAIYIDYDINERLAEIGALQAMGSDEAITVLTTFLRDQNRRQLEGLGPRDYRTIRATIRALADSGSQLPREDLTMVEISGWTPAVEATAAEALRMLDAAAQ